MMRLVAAAMALAGTAPPASAQIAFELKSGWRQAIPYSSVEDWAFAEGGFWLLANNTGIGADGTAELVSTSIVRADALTGDRTVAATSERLPIPTYITPDYFVAAYSGITVIERKTGRIMGSKLLKDQTRDVMIDGKTLYALQIRPKDKSHSDTDTILARFSLEGLEYLGETVLPHLNEQVRFQGGEIVGIGYGPWGSAIGRCSEDSLCPTVFRTRLDGTVRSQVMLQTKKRPQPSRGCIAAIRLVTADKVFVEAGCGTYVAVDGAVTRVLYNLPRPVVDKDFDLAVSGNILLARPENAIQHHGEKLEIQPVEAFDLETGRPLGSAMLPPGRLRTAGDKIVLATRSRESYLEVLVYDVNTR